MMQWLLPACSLAWNIQTECAVASCSTKCRFFVESLDPRAPVDRVVCNSGCVKPSTCTETRVRARTRAQAHVVRAHLDGDALFIVMWELNCVRISVIWNIMPCSLVQTYGRFGGICHFHLFFFVSLSRRILGCKWLRF